MSLFQQSGVQLSRIDKLSKHSIDATFETALALLDNTSSWEDVKKYNEADGHVIQYSRQYARPGEKLMWHMRSSEHGPEMDLSYAEFRAGLLLVRFTGSASCGLPCSTGTSLMLSLHRTTRRTNSSTSLT